MSERYFQHHGDALPAISWFKARFAYTPETGVFWSKRRGRPVGGSYNGGVCISYRMGKKRRNVMAHRLAYAFQTGRWPEGVVCHINGCKSDNRWTNLRPETWSEAMRRVRAGERRSFVRLDRRGGFYVVSIAGHPEAFRFAEKATAFALADRLRSRGI